MTEYKSYQSEARCEIDYCTVVQNLHFDLKSTDSIQEIQNIAVYY